VKKDYAELRKQNEVLLSENRELNNAVTVLQDKVRTLEQYTRNTNIEISGIPVSPREDPLRILKDVAVVLGHELRDEQVMAAHRVPSYNKDRTPSLVCQFQTRVQRDAWLSSFKKKKILNASEVNRAFPTNRVYINEHLSPDNKIFLAKLKQKCKEQAIKYVWPKEGKFFVRKIDGGKCYRIDRLDDLREVV